MRNIADMTVYDANGQLTLLVEAKKKLGASSEWAAKMRRNILANGLSPETKFFLLAIPDRFYLWKDSGVAPEKINPTYEIDPDPFLRPYYEKSGLTPENMSGAAFEFMISSRLSEINLADEAPPQLPLKTIEWLIESGFLEALAGGRVEFEATV